MDLLTKDLLINFLFILLPLCLLQLLYLLKYTYRFKELEEWTFALFPILSIALCMLFPVLINDDYIWDLRRIPLILAMLYGGPALSTFLLSMIVSTRYLTFDGGTVFYIFLMADVLLLLSTMLVSKRYKEMTIKSKTMVSCALTFLSIVPPVILSEYLFPTSISAVIWFEFIFINVVGMLIITLLWETIRTNFDMLKQLMNAEKIEIVSHLAASISHEVRNPLTVSRGFMQLSADENLSVDKRKRFIDTSIEELDRAADIINDYLTFAKPSHDDPEHIHALTEVEHIVQVMTPLANMHGVQIISDLLQNDDHLVKGDRKKFQQSLINILKNAIESMQNGGELVVFLRSFHSKVHIVIYDEGKGMTPEQVNRLGEPYFTTKQAGTGLGMMLTYNVIQEMGGKINVDSEPGKGTCFALHLPVVISS